MSRSTKLAGTLLIDIRHFGPGRVYVADWLEVGVAHYIDAAIAASSGPARRGEATIVVSGADDDVQRAVPIWKVVPHRFTFGPTGYEADAWKLVVDRPRPQPRRSGRRARCRATVGINPGAAVEILKPHPLYNSDQYEGGDGEG